MKINSPTIDKLQLIVNEIFDNDDYDTTGPIHNPRPPGPPKGTLIK